MASFKPTIITKKGHALMAKIVAGKATPKFTKISVSDHEYSSSTNFESVTNLSSIKQTTLVSSVSKINSAAVKVSGALSNAELSTGYYLRTIGLYASDPSEGEILYSITTATKPDWIPPNNGVSASSIMIDLITVVSNASNVSIDVDPNATATVAQINELKDEMDKNKTVPFSNGGNSVTSYPVGTKGLIRLGAKGVEPVRNLLPKWEDTNTNGIADGWTTGFCPTVFLNNGVQSFTPTEQFGSINYKFPDDDYKEGEYVYFAMDCKTVATGVQIYVNDGVGQTGNLIANDGNWHRKSVVRQITTNPLRSLVKIQDNSSSGWSEIQVKNPVVFKIPSFDKTYYDSIGYVEGFATSAQSYDLVSRGKNLFDVSKFIDVFDKYKTYYKINDNRTGIYATTIHDTRSWSGMPLYDGLNANTYTITADNPSNGTLAIYDEFTNSVLNTRDTNINKSFTLPTGKFKLKYLADKNAELSNIQIERGAIPTPYESYISTKTGFSVPRALLEIGDSKDEILDNGDVVYKNSKTILNGNGSWMPHKETTDYISFYQPNPLQYTPANAICNKMVFEKWDGTLRNKEYMWEHGSASYGICVLKSKLTTLNVAGFKQWLQEQCNNNNPIIIYYQLKTPEIIQDGEQGYQAPSPLPAYQNGDLVLLPKHHKKYQANSTTTITLDEEISDLDYARTEIDGKIVDLDCTLKSDGKTVTIPETTGWVDIKGTIPAKNCLNPKICADMPANLGTITSANTTSIANLQQKYDKHENIQDLINLEMDYRLTILENN